MSLNTPVIITTINEPTEAITKFSKITNKLIVIGDKKTPISWSVENVHFFSFDYSQSLDYNIIPLLPANSYTRKLIGYLIAMKDKPKYIAESDDDNIPYKDWEFSKSVKENFLITETGLGFFNFYKHFTDKFIWPRGLPLKRIYNSPKTFKKISENRKVPESNIRLWQALADGDPDVDAIYRLTRGEEVIFDERSPMILSTGSYIPINSQNTMFHKDIFVLMYLPSFVPFRFTDILRGLIALPIMELYNYTTLIEGATVFQKRNEHDLMKDFELEIECYLYPEKINEIVIHTISKDLSMSENLLNVYKELINNGFVPKKELNLLKAWILDVEELNG